MEASSSAVTSVDNDCNLNPTNDDKKESNAEECSIVTPEEKDVIAKTEDYRGSEHTGVFLNAQLILLANSCSKAVNFMKDIHELEWKARTLLMDEVWKPCTGLEFHNIPGLPIMSALARVLEKLGNSFSDRCEDTAKQLDEVWDFWNMKIKFESLIAGELKFTGVGLG